MSLHGEEVYLVLRFGGSALDATVMKVALAMAGSGLWKELGHQWGGCSTQLGLYTMGIAVGVGGLCQVLSYCRVCNCKKI